jgi:hypothetical protein
MNCKPNDLAVIYRASPDDAWAIGRVVRCVSTYVSFWGCVAWYTEDEIVGPDGSAWEGVADEMLKPIRDSDGEDESLSWLSVPSSGKVTA